jgi:hypothetical protein
MLAQKVRRTKPRGNALFSYRQRLTLFLEGLRSNPYRIKTYRGTRFLEDR